MSDRTYIQIPGDRTHELPPLLIHPLVNYGEAEFASRLDEVVDLAGDIVESEDMIRRRRATKTCGLSNASMIWPQLAEKYSGLVAHWQWGDSIL